MYTHIHIYVYIYIYVLLYEYMYNSLDNCKSKPPQGKTDNCKSNAVSTEMGEHSGRDRCFRTKMWTLRTGSPLMVFLTPRERER